MISYSVSLANGVLMPPIYHTASVLLGALNEFDRLGASLLTSPARGGRG